MTTLAGEVLERLRTVPEPCSLLMGAPTNIVDMGLVEHIEIHAGTARVTLVLTDPSCIHFTSLQRYITDVALELPGVEEVLVAVSTTQLWTPDRSGAARRLDETALEGAST